tara:strand:- start:309 stop:569 length:261 start_codon:yes stop_codon:yes gene_type:complete
VGNGPRNSSQSQPESRRKPASKDASRFDVEDATFSSSRNSSDRNKQRIPSRAQSPQNKKNASNPGRYNQKPPNKRGPRDNSSRFDD